MSDLPIVPWPLQAMADVMNRFTFVRWDRMVESDFEGTPHMEVKVYGWIDREDSHADFVILTFVTWAEMVGFTTSSDKHSQEISKILYGPDLGHTPCARIEHVFGDLVHDKITL